MSSIHNCLIVFAAVLLALANTIAPSSAQGQSEYYSLADYRATIAQGADGKAILSIYAHGFMLSVRAMNIAHTDGGQRGKFQFCPGDKEDVGEIVPMEKVMDAIARYVETLPKYRNEGEVPFAPILFEAMRRRFPCP